MDIVEWIDKIMENDTIKIVSFILGLAGAIGIPLSIKDAIKYVIKLIKSGDARNTTLGYIIIVLYILVGLIIPLFLIIGLWSNPFSWWRLTLQVLAWYLLTSFALLIYIIIKVELILQESEKEDKKKKK